VENVREAFSFPGIVHAGLAVLLMGLLTAGSAIAAGDDQGQEEFEPITLVILQSAPEDAEVLKKCTYCHMFTRSEIKKQDRLARKKHKRVLSGQKVCLDCHESGEMCCHETVFTAVTLVPYATPGGGQSKGL
jgi:hypothetical protein